MRHLGATKIAELQFGFRNFLSVLVLRQHAFEHGLLITQVLFGEDAAPQEFSCKGVVDAAKRYSRETEVVASHGESLVAKRLSIV